MYTCFSYVVVLTFYDFKVVYISAFFSNWFAALICLDFPRQPHTWSIICQLKCFMGTVGPGFWVGLMSCLLSKWLNHSNLCSTTAVQRKEVSYINQRPAASIIPPPPLNIWRLNPPALFLKPVPLHAVNTCIGATLTQKVEQISVKVAASTSGAAGMMECTALRGRVSLSSTRQVLGSSFVAPRSFQ